MKTNIFRNRWIIGIGLAVMWGLFFSGVNPKGSSAKVYIIGDSKKSIIEMLNNDHPYSYNWFFNHFIERYKGRPYGAMPYEKIGGYRAGMTLVNVETMDCVTFLENFIAAALTYKKLNNDYRVYTNEQKFQMFMNHLDGIRYYNGANCTWNDRIYYFTHALDVMEKEKKLLKSVGAMAGVPFKKKINYVSTNIRKFSGITDWKRIHLMEKRLSEAKLFYFPLDKLEDYRQVAYNGDLVALATDVKGLDVSHCGFIHVQEGDLYFSHASSVAKQVVHKEDFRNYLSKRTSITGIFVYRPLF
jgi:hypothetical protein